MINSPSRLQCLRLALLVTASGLTAGAAFAQDAGGPGVSFELGLGGVVAPRYEGSDKYLLSPYPIIRLERFELENGFSIGGGDGQGLSFRPSFRFISERDASDDPALAGLSTVEQSIELGGGVKYGAGPISAFVDLRYGVTGHNGLVGEVGLDYGFEPIDKLTLSLGPRLSFASSDYMNTYFGVSAADSVTSGYAPYTAGGGFKSAGLEATARYQFTDVWAAEAGAGWNRLVGDAADSPLIAAGSEDQFTVKFGLMRKFRIDF